MTEKSEKLEKKIMAAEFKTEKKREEKAEEWKEIYFFYSEWH